MLSIPPLVRRLLCATSLALASLTALAGGWRLTDLGTDGLNSGAYAINNQGDVVGWEHNGTTGKDDPFVFRSGQKIRIGTLGGSTAVAWDLNNQGDVVGWSSTAGDAGYHAFIYRNGVMTDLGTLGGVQAQAHRINDAGQIAGRVRMADGTEQVFLFSAGQLTFPQGLNGRQIRTIRMNNSGQLALEIDVLNPVGFPTEPFLYSAGTVTALSRAGSNWTFIGGLDDHGTVAGYSGNYGFGPKNFGLYNANTHTVIGARQGDTFEYIVGMNNKGQIIGYVTDDLGIINNPYIYDIRTGRKTYVNDLPLPGLAAWRIQELLDINDKGQLVGYAQDRLTGRLSRAFILSPLSE